MRHSLRRLLALASAATLLTACGGGDSSPRSSTLSGTAATGLPITNATVTVQCQAGPALTATTNATTGRWQVTLGSSAQLPCALQVSGGSLPGGVQYHSLALAAGTVNITPWTDLVLANATQQAPANWYASTQLASNLQALSQAALDAALARVNTQLGVNNALVDSRNPFTASFQADGTDKIDKVLDAIQTALTSAGVSYAGLLAEALKGGSFTAPAAFSGALNTQLANLGTGSGGSGSCTSPAVSLAYSGNAGGPVANGASLCFGTISASTLAFGSTTLSNPVLNTLVSAPYSAYVFTDSGHALKYEVIFNGNSLHEINLSTSADTFLGQFAAASSGGSSSNASTATGVTIPGGTAVAASVVPTYTALINGAGNKIIRYTDTASGASLEVYDYVSYITVGAAKTGFSATLSCALTSAASNFYPLCSVAGVAFDRSAGTLGFNEATMGPLVQMSYACSPTTTPCRINGSLTFSGYQ